METRSSRARVLVVDDEIGFRSLLTWRLNEIRLDVQTANDGQEALKALETTDFDLVIADLSMPNIQGLDVLRAVKKSRPLTEVIILTGFATIETAVYAVKMGAFDFLLKPFDLSVLCRAVEDALIKRAGS